MRLWVKLHVQLLDDPKVAVMPDGLFRTFINLMAIAGRVDQNGKLGTSADIAYWLRKDAVEVTLHMAALEKCNVCVTKDGVWRLKNWQKFNKVAASNKPKAIRERVQKYRENKAKADAEAEEGNADVTRYENVSNAYREEKNREEKKEKAADAPPARKPVKNEYPAVEVFRTAAGAYPIKTLWQSMDEAIGSKPDDLTFWQQVVTAWVAKGWNPRNIQGMFDFYKRRELPANGKPQPPSKPPTKFIEYS